jgi:hypothetical protein
MLHGCPPDNSESRNRDSNEFYYRSGDHWLNEITHSSPESSVIIAIGIDLIRNRHLKERANLLPAESILEFDMT